MFVGSSISACVCPGVTAVGQPLCVLSVAFYDFQAFHCFDNVLACQEKHFHLYHAVSNLCPQPNTFWRHVHVTGIWVEEA